MNLRRRAPQHSRLQSSKPACNSQRSGWTHPASSLFDVARARAQSTGGFVRRAVCHIALMPSFHSPIARWY